MFKTNISYSLIFIFVFPNRFFISFSFIIFFVLFSLFSAFLAACRYEKGTWTECSGQSQMVRVDKLKSNSDPSCEQSRQITKKCKSKTGKTKNSKTANYQTNPNRKNTSGKYFFFLCPIEFSTRKKNSAFFLLLF